LIGNFSTLVFVIMDGPANEGGLLEAGRSLSGRNLPLCTEFIVLDCPDRKSFASGGI